MTEERLKGSATLRRTVNLGNFNSISAEATLQFFQDASNIKSTLDTIDIDLLAWFEARGIKNEVKAIVK